MKIDYEKFIEKALDSGMADEFESKIFKKQQKEAMKWIDELSEELLATLNSHQRELYDKILDLEIEHDGALEKQAFYKGYMLARSFCAD